MACAMPEHQEFEERGRILCVESVDGVDDFSVFILPIFTAKRVLSRRNASCESLIIVPSQYKSFS
jgi:hypothetical protein